MKEKVLALDAAAAAAALAAALAAWNLVGSACRRTVVIGDTVRGSFGEIHSDSQATLSLP